MQLRRVVITGLGVLAPNGCGKDAFWQACLQGRSGVSSITRFDASVLPTRIAGEIADFVPAAFGLTPVECTLLDRGTQLAVAAANLALHDAGLSSTNLSARERERMGVYLGTAMGAVAEGERLWLQLTESGAHPPYALLHGNEHTRLLLSYVPSTAIAAHHLLRGPCLTIATGCSAGADAIGQAFWKIQEGYAERMLTGGSDSAISLLGLNVFCVMRALSTRNDEPKRASRPYDARRDGFVLSEGAAVLLLEERELALSRGVHIYAEMHAFASNANAYHMAALPKDGVPLQSLLWQALKETKLSPEQLGYINSHGSSTLANEAAETAAYKEALGAHAYHIPISATKSLIGHTQGASSAIEVLVTALALDRQILPPTINLETPDPCCDLDYIPNAARPVDPRQPLRFALTHSSGFGGVNTALVLASKEQHGVTNVAWSVCKAAPFSTSATYPRVPLARISLSPRRVVITGLGVVAPNGIGKEAFWSAIRAGRSSIGPLTSSDVTQHIQVAGAVRDFRVEDYVERKLANCTDRMTHFVFAAVQEALQDAKLALAQEDPQRIGAVIANTLGGVEYVAQQIELLYKRGARFMSAYTAIAWLQVANVGRLSVRYGLQGYCKTPVNDTCGGLDALGLAYEAIRRGAADVLITGGSEAPLQSCALHVLGDSPAFYVGAIPCAYRPFDLRAGGLLIAEGAGICILEEYEHARCRGVPIYGEIVGYAQTSIPWDLAAPALPDVPAYARCLNLVLDQAHLEPRDIACIYLDGRALPAWDAVEAAALYDVFGSALGYLPCSVPRTQFGHSLAAAGVLDTICALMALQDCLVPPTLNCEQPDVRHCPAGLVRGRVQAQDRRAHAVLLCARGLGGSHATLALRKV
jgi:3-oxoacyl-(acyl-carrier-protein) synthase